MGMASPLLEGKGGLCLNNNEMASELTEDKGELRDTDIAPGVTNPAKTGLPARPRHVEKADPELSVFGSSVKKQKTGIACIYSYV